MVLISDDEKEEEQQGSGEVIDVNPPRGTRDFPPEEMRLRNWLFHNFREVRGIFRVSLRGLS